MNMSFNLKSASKVFTAKKITNGLVSAGDLDTEVSNFKYAKLEDSTSDSFSITTLLGTENWNLLTAYQCMTNSEFLNNAKKNGKTQQFKLFDFSLIVIPGLKPNKSRNVVSYNRFMAVCIGMICFHNSWKVFNWKNKKYMDSTSNIRFEASDEFLNKLAMSAGFSKEHKYHWFYATGYEYTFEVFPAEVIAMTLFRWAHKDELKIKSKHESELVAPMVRQILKKGTIDEVMKLVGKAKIAEKYAEIVEDRSSVSTKINYDQVLKEFKSIAKLIDDGSKDSDLKEALSGISD
uniref:P3 nucleocapsid n=1 Tax=Emaravirus tritici TaxID=1980428 RepID=A0A7T8D003_9VIRU|nr:P3 nucleocapsid [Emaravirus tritici]